MIQLNEMFYPGCVPGHVWWKKLDGGYQRKDGLAIRTANSGGYICEKEGVKIEGKDLHPFMEQVDRTFPMPHPGIRSGQLWRLNWEKRSLDVTIDVFLSLEGVLKWSLSSLIMGEQEMRTMLDPAQVLYKGKPLFEDMEKSHPKVFESQFTKSVILLADPHFPHLAPFYAVRTQ